MVDPEDVLNTGIDIDVQPPGKTVQNIRLFSGGEKKFNCDLCLVLYSKSKNDATMYIR